jgi:hypothetical protein
MSRSFSKFFDNIQSITFRKGESMSIIPIPEEVLNTVGLSPALEENVGRKFTLAIQYSPKGNIAGSLEKCSTMIAGTITGIEMLNQWKEGYPDLHLCISNTLFLALYPIIGINISLGTGVSVDIRLDEKNPISRTGLYGSLPEKFDVDFLKMEFRILSS